MIRVKGQTGSPFTLTAKVRLLIWSRIVLIFLLLFGSWWWTTSYLQLPPEEFPAGLFILFLLSGALSVIYALFVRFNGNHMQQVRAQLAVDVLLITWLVWQTGDAISPYVALYIIATGVAGYFLNRNETLWYSVFSALVFVMLSLLCSQQIIHSISSSVANSRKLQVVAFNCVAILVVGLLSARISERRRITEELRETMESFAEFHILHERIVESIRSGLVTTDLEGRVFAFNPAAAEISGYKASEVIGWNITDIFGEAIRGPVEICLGKAVATGFQTELFETEITTVSPDAEKPSVTVACSIVPLVSRAGRVTGLILTFQDLTELRAMEESLRRSDRLAAVGRMAAGLAHEIRNPLGSISAALQFLREKAVAEEDSALMDVVMRESARLDGIITSFLTYARPSADVFRKNGNTETDLGEALRDCFALLRHSPEIKETHRLECELPAAPVRIRANETQIRQIFWNLSRNSIQAMPDGGRLKVRLREHPGKNVQIVFEDTGTGIDPNYLEHLFEPFSDHASGTGLGLSIVHKIVTDHGGRIEVENGKKAGTKVTVELPA